MTLERFKMRFFLVNDRTTCAAMTLAVWCALLMSIVAAVFLTAPE